MNQRSLYVLWGILFILCAALGFIPEPAGVLKYGMPAASILFFLPPAWLLRQAAGKQDRRTLLLIRNLSALSLGLTLGVLILTFVTAAGASGLGNALHALLVVVSTPMICSGYWVLSLFLWACLLTAARTLLRKA